VLCFLPSTHCPLYDFDLRATHARTLLPAALASVSFGFVLVRVRVRWCADSGALVVWYFDTPEAEKCEISEEAKLEAIERGTAFDCPDFLRVREIQRWVFGRALNAFGPVQSRNHSSRGNS
jgi:hypothetical protein